MIRIEDVIENMECLNDEDRCYLHLQTQTFYSPIIEDLRIAEEYELDDDLSRYPEWERASILDAVDFLEHEGEYIPLPSSFDINEYEIMEEFCEQIRMLRLETIYLQSLMEGGHLDDLRMQLLNII